MEKHGYTVILVPHATGSRRSVLVTKRRVQILGVFALICVLAVMRVGYGYYRQHETRSKLNSAERANAVMVERLEGLETRNRDLESRVVGLNNQMIELEQLESRIREMAGLSEKTDDVSEDGVALGGRGGRYDDDVGVDVYSVGGTSDSATFNDLLARISEYKDSFTDLTSVLETEQRRIRSIPCIHPTDGPDVWKSSSFAWRKNPFSGNRQFHNGVDYAGPLGTPVIATGDGKVVEAKWDTGLGWLVVIDHGFGYKTRYGHNQELDVKTGDLVKRGETIAKMGSTGKSTGPHVHYEILLNGKAQNPVKHFLD